MIPRKFWKEIQANFFVGNIKSRTETLNICSLNNDIVGGFDATSEINNCYVGANLSGAFDEP